MTTKKKETGKSKKTGSLAVSLECEVSPGMFSNERGVRLTLASGEIANAVMDATDVAVTEQLRPGQQVRGKVRAFVVEERKDTLIVDLPQPTLTGGHRIEVSKTIVG